jgi:hypothetical protein
MQMMQGNTGLEQWKGSPPAAWMDAAILLACQALCSSALVLAFRKRPLPPHQNLLPSLVFPEFSCVFLYSVFYPSCYLAFSLCFLPLLWLFQ